MNRSTLFLGLLLLTTACGADRPLERPPKASPPPLASSSTPAPSAARAEPTDTDIARVVARELAFDGAVPDDALDVTVREGIVSLTGSVPHLLAKVRATRVAEAVRGVRSVSNRMAVRGPDRPDPAIVSAVRAALTFDPTAEGYEVDVESHRGEVTLTGTVDAWPEQRHCTRIAQRVAGVKGVDNRIEVARNTSRVDREIAEDVRAALRWDVLIDEAMVRARVEQGVVHLTGVVGSAAERRMVLDRALVLGARRIDDKRLEVAPWTNRARLRDRRYLPVSDEALASAVTDVLAADPRVARDEVAVTVDDARVTLEGTASSLRAKRVAGRLARHTTGVIAVTNALIVTPSRVYDDAALEGRVGEALGLNPITEGYEVKPEASAGIVTLKGEVDTYRERAEVVDVVAGLAGVRAVEDRLTVRQPLEAFVYDPYVGGPPAVTTGRELAPSERALSDSGLREAVKRELSWQPRASAWQIDVLVDDGVVTLRGQVDDAAEVEAAIAHAYAAGATSVDNQLNLRN